MSYFSNQYKALSYPQRDSDSGLYNAQLGAIHSIAAHFTIHKMPGIVTMPTGSGKTAVLLMTPFVLSAARVLIITPSRMVRGQIFEDAKELKVLKDIGVVKQTIRLPKTIEIKSKITSLDQWNKLKKFDIVVATPNCISPSYEDISEPPQDLFDVILIDESHHSPARTWQDLLDYFKNAKKILFTATPFRRDRKEIQGRFIYSYPLIKAHEDGIFGTIRFIPVNEPNDRSQYDQAIAIVAARTFRDDRAAGFAHYLMVRTDSKKKAEQLLDVYRQHTGLRLELIHSGISYAKSKEAIAKLIQSELDGIICVDMLGEGFNLPNLKIAAIHTPHKSLEITLQFIGRFARTNAQNIGEAKFLAIPSEIEIEGERLFKDDAVWQDVISNMSHLRITDEIETREMLQDFDNPLAEDEETRDLSLYSLYPRNHVKIYKVSQQIDLRASLDLEESYQVIYKNINDNASVAVFIVNETTRPRWLKIDKLLDVKFDLFVVYYDIENGFLFINSSRSVDGLYTTISQSLDSDAKLLPTSVINKVLKGLNNANYFNIGMRTILATNNTESYRILAGGGTQDAIKKSDSRLFRQGHAFCTADDEETGKRVNIGFSSASKVWSGSSSQIPKLISWCKLIAEKLVSRGQVHTNTGFDNLGAGEVITTLPVNIISGSWDKEAYDFSHPIMAHYVNTQQQNIECHISDLEIDIDHENTNSSQIVFSVEGEGMSCVFKFTLDNFYESLNPTANGITLTQNEHSISLLDFINSEAPINFYTSDFSLLIYNELFKSNFEGVFFDADQIQVIDWNGVNIQNEFNVATSAGISIHEYLRDSLLSDPSNRIVFYDHGKGEIADFVVIKELDDSFVFRLYHCKKSGSLTPSNRVEDIYEVCGQAQRSIIWRNRNKIVQKITMRARKIPAKFLKGSLQVLDSVYQDLRPRKLEIVIVQPGISKAALDINISNNLGATDDLIISGGGEKLVVLASA
jgi:superfamily II DNA or RNA helicase